MATHAQVARHLDLTRQAVSQMFDEGIFPDHGRGKADIDECRVLYIRRLREQAAGRAGGGSDLNLTDERARKAKLEADILELNYANRRGQLLAREDVDAAVIGAFARVRARLLNTANKVAPLVMAVSDPHEAQEIIESAIYDALQELSETTVADLCGDDEELVEDPGAASEADGQ